MELYRPSQELPKSLTEFPGLVRDQSEERRQELGRPTFLLYKIYQEINAASLSTSKYVPRTIDIAQVKSFVRGALHYLADPQRRVYDSDLQIETMIRRLGQFAEASGWMLFTIVAHSANFRDASLILDDHPWDACLDTVKTNARSLEIFAKVRGLQWDIVLNSVPDPQLRLLDCREKYSIRSSTYVHTYVVPQHDDEMLSRPKEGEDAFLPITQNYYSPAAFDGFSRPDNWLAGIPYPSDPSKLIKHKGNRKSQCFFCQHQICHCNTSSNFLVKPPLVELQRYPIRGVGVRVLEPIHNRQILGEYTGEMRSAKDDDYDCVYPVGMPPPTDKSGPSVARISGRKYGNWMRFMNHSCDPHTVLKVAIIGGRARILVVATKDVQPFEELTTDYGEGYFEANEILCRCGSANCISVVGGKDTSDAGSSELSDASSLELAELEEFARDME